MLRGSASKAARLERNASARSSVATMPPSSLRAHPEPLPFCEKPHNLVPTSRRWGHQKIKGF